MVEEIETLFKWGYILYKCEVCGKPHNNYSEFFFEHKKIASVPFFCSANCIQQTGVSCTHVIPCYQSVSIRGKAYEWWGQKWGKIFGYRDVTFHLETGIKVRIFLYVINTQYDVERLTNFINKIEKKIIEGGSGGN